MGITDWAKDFAAFAKRMVTLEERVTALEKAQGKQASDACPYCGERAMRKTKDGRVLGGPPNKWKEDVWTCEVCKKDEVRMVPLKGP